MPSDDKEGYPSFVGLSVSWVTFVPSQSMIQTSKSPSISELKAIRTLLASNTVKNEADKPSEDEPDEKVNLSVKSKGGTTWDDYIMSILKRLGGRAKSKDISEVILKANPKFNRSKTKVAVRQHLSRMNKENIIMAEKSDIQSEGYTYYLKE